MLNLAKLVSKYFKAKFEPDLVRCNIFVSLYCLLKISNLSNILLLLTLSFISISTFNAIFLASESINNICTLILSWIADFNPLINLETC